MIILFTVVEDQRTFYIFEEKFKFSPMADLLRAKLNLSRDRVSYLVKIPPSSTPRDFDEKLLSKSHRNPIRAHSNKYTTGTPPARSMINKIFYSNMALGAQLKITFLSLKKVLKDNSWAACGLSPKPRFLGHIFHKS